MKKIFVTGGAGFIGSHLVDSLIKEGNFVTVYDDFSSGKREFINHHLGSRNFNLVEADILNLSKIKKAIKGHDLVFHLAANPDARLGIKQTDLDLKLETLCTYNVLESMRLANVKEIILASSGTIYGEAPDIPLNEDYGPCLPISLYGAGKLASEGLATAYSNTFSMKSWIFRFGNVVGPRATHGVIFDFINKLKKDPKKLEILGDGTQKKPYLHVSDCISGMLFGHNNSKKIVNVFNLGCDSETNVNSIAKMLVSEIGLEKVKFNYSGGDRGWPGDVPKCKFDVSRMTKLGWKTKNDSDGAVKIAIKEIVDEMWRAK